LVFEDNKNGSKLLKKHGIKFHSLIYKFKVDGKLFFSFSFAVLVFLNKQTALGIVYTCTRHGPLSPIDCPLEGCFFVHLSSVSIEKHLVTEHSHVDNPVSTAPTLLNEDSQMLSIETENPQVNHPVSTTSTPLYEDSSMFSMEIEHPHVEHPIFTTSTPLNEHSSVETMETECSHVGHPISTTSTPINENYSMLSMETMETENISCVSFAIIIAVI
jgi:hypothetical protein